MRAAGMFVEGLADSGLIGTVSRLQVELFGSLGATGKGHGTDKALLLGLQGEVPEQVDTDSIPARIEQVRSSGRLLLPGNVELAFDVDKDLIFHRRKVLPYHPNSPVATFPGVSLDDLTKQGDELLAMPFLLQASNEFAGM